MADRLGLGLGLTLEPVETIGSYRERLAEDWRRLLQLALVARDACVIDGAMRILALIQITEASQLWDARHRLHDLWIMASGVLQPQGSA